MYFGYLFCMVCCMLVGGLSYIIVIKGYKSNGKHSCGKQNKDHLAVSDVMEYGLRCFAMM